MAEKDLLGLVKKLKGKEEVDRPVFRLSKPGQNNPLKMKAGAASGFAQKHNQSEVREEQAPPDGEELMRMKHLGESGKLSAADLDKYQMIVNSLPPKKPGRKL